MNGCHHPHETAAPLSIASEDNHRRNSNQEVSRARLRKADRSVGSAPPPVGRRRAKPFSNLWFGSELRVGSVVPLLVAAFTAATRQDERAGDYRDEHEDPDGNPRRLRNGIIASLRADVWYIVPVDVLVL